MFDIEIAGTLFYVQGGRQWRSWNVRHDHPVENFQPVYGLKADTTVLLKPGRNEIALRNSVDTNTASRSDGYIQVHDVDYEFLRTVITINTGFSLRGRVILQIDIELTSQLELLGLRSDFEVKTTKSIVPLGPPHIRNLDGATDWDFNRSWRAFVPVLIREANPALEFTLIYQTKVDEPPKVDRVTIDITCIVQLMNSVLNLSLIHI